jgi:hypothetical protein
MLAAMGGQDSFLQFPILPASVVLDVADQHG